MVQKLHNYGYTNFLYSFFFTYIPLQIQLTGLTTYNKTKTNKTLVVVLT